MLLLYYFECAPRCSAECDKRIFTGEGNHFPRTAKGSPLRESRKNRQVLAMQGVQEKFSAVVTSVISVQ